MVHHYHPVSVSIVVALATAQNQNITVGVSFGATRELAFLHAATGNKIYFPQVP